MNSSVQIEIWSDVQCVWCYVSDARWKRALQSFGGNVELVHRSFELQPDFPAEFDAQEYLAKDRGLDAAAQERVFSVMKRTLSEEGLDYAPERIRPTNSHLALELLHHAEAVGLRDQLSERLFEAYFAQGAHLGTVDELCRLASEAGLDPARTRVVLQSGFYRDSVDADSERARALGARGVPFVVIDEKYVVPGAMEVDELLRILREVTNSDRARSL